MSSSTNKSKTQASSTSTTTTTTSGQQSETYKAAIHFAAGGLGGCVGAIFTQPLDVLKTRLQSSVKIDSIQQGHYNNQTSTAGTTTGRSWSHLFRSKTLASLQLTFKNEGMSGLFRGLAPNLIGIVPSRAIYFSSYNTTKSFLEKFGYFNDKNKTNNNSDASLEHASPLIHILSAASAGVVVPTIMNPVFLVKTRIQLEQFSRTHTTSALTSAATSSASISTGTPNYKGYSDCIRRIYAEEGIRGFYHGLTASFLGIAETAIYFVLYERAKKYSLQQKFAKSGLTEEEFWKTEAARSFSPMEYIVLSGGCKLLASALTYPHEVVRTRARERVNGVCRYNKGLINAFSTIAREEGYRGLYSGMGAHMLRVVPNTAIMFLTYEFVVWLADSASDERKREELATPTEVTDEE